MDYRRMLEEGYDFESGIGRLEYLSEYIFDFTTDDGEMAELFARKALEVCEAISDRATFEYIKDAENYRWFLLLCNTPFFADRLNWSTSIRGAWWDQNNSTLYPSGLWLNGKQVTELEFSGEQWPEFVAAMLAFAKEPDTEVAGFAAEVDQPIHHQERTMEEKTEIEISYTDRAMQEQKITLLLLWKLAGREPVTLTQDDMTKINAEFAGSMPVLYGRETGGELTYQVIDANEVEAIEADVKAANAKRIVEAMAPGAYPQGRLAPNAVQKAIERAGGQWPGPTPVETDEPAKS